MTTTHINSETICDLQGKALLSDSVILVKALDKLLTVGAYYAADHDQYIQASSKACTDIVGVIGSSGKPFIIEITAQGMMIGKQNIDPHHRNVRLLHELLVPLNIARLEISGSLTPEDLRQAISALQAHKAALGQSNSFREIIFEDLPDSVRTVSCSVLQQTEEDVAKEAVESGLDELLGQWDDNDSSVESTESESGSEKLARRFMDMVSQILENLEQLEDKSGNRVLEGEAGSYVTKEDLVNLKQALKRLVEVDPDPAELTKLITQAQRALDLSRDSRSVNLVFSILKNEMVKKNDGVEAKKEPKPRPIEYKLTIEELLEAVAELEKSDLPVDDPLAGAQGNHLAISLHLLRSDPPWALRTGMVDAIELAVASPDFPTQNLLVCALTIDSIVREEGVEALDDLLPLLMGVLRQKRSEMIAPFWVHLTDLAGEEQLPKLWPHLVNDILLGFEGVSYDTVTKLVLKAGNIPLHVAKGLGRRLEKQAALNGGSPARDLFSAPLTRLYPVLAMLMATPLRGWLGTELFRALRLNPGSPLIEVVLQSLDEHKPELSEFYLNLILHHDNTEPPADMQELVVEILQGKLSALSPEERREDWVPKGFSILGELDPAGARPLLERVLNERKFLFFKSWPEPVREAATKALNTNSMEVQ